MAQLPPIPYRTALLDSQGLVTRPWQQWFEALLARVGGTGDVATNDELETIVASAATVSSALSTLTALGDRVEALEMQRTFVSRPSEPVEGQDIRVFRPVVFVEDLAQRVASLEMLGTIVPSVASLEALTQRVADLEIEQIFT